MTDTQRTNLEFQLNANQSFHRLDPKTKAIITNKILGELREMFVANGENWLTVFRQHADRELRNANFDKSSPFAVWSGIHRKCSMLAAKELQESEPEAVGLNSLLERANIGN